jgi:hypothetical protein
MGERMTTDTALINSRIDILQTAEAAGAHFRKSGKDYHSTCPIHGGDNPGAFVVFGDLKSWKCFTRDECNRFGHDGIGLLRALNNWTFNEVKAQYETPVDPQEAARRAAQNAERIAKELQEKIEQAQKALEDLQKAKRWLEYHANLGEGARELWRERGIPDEWQNYWKLGYSLSCPTFTKSPSLTIPLFYPNESEPRNIKHRLLTPDNPKDKYRPEKSGLPATPFFADDTLPIAAADRVILVEGEIKAAVTYLTLNRPLWQVVGLPGKDNYRMILDELQGRRDTVILLDPDAKNEAVKMARSIGGAKVADLPEKVDDMIVNYGLDSNWLDSVFNNARFVA